MIVLLNPPRAEHGPQKSTRMKRTRRNHAPEFKAQVALVAIPGDQTLAELAEHVEVYPNQISAWTHPLTASAVDGVDETPHGPGRRA